MYQSPAAEADGCSTIFTTT